jgi:anthranilate synthase component 1
MYPTLETVKQLAASGEYKRIPVCRELYADRYTPVEVMRILRKASRHCYLLESASQTEQWGRYSFLGYHPTMEITCTDGHLTIRSVDEDGQQVISEKDVKHPNETLRKILDQYKSPVLEELPPFTGGLVGYFSYDYIKYSEPKLNLSDVEGTDFRDMDLMLFDQVIAFDHYKQKVMLITGVMIDQLDESYERAERKLEEMAELIRHGEKKEFKRLKLQSEIKPQFPKERYCEMVEQARRYIYEGDIFQVVLSNPMRAKAEGSLFDTYRVLRATNPSPYMFYFNSDDIEIAGASPETLVKLEKDRLHTFPLAGTRPRGKTREEDKELEAGLLADEKELSEHNMLVDLGRNDIGKISRIGTVEVEKYLTVERFSHVMHLGSTVTGRIKPENDAVDAVDAILPAGTLSGAPKFRACQIIQELEQSKRGIYGGAIGYLDFAGNLDTCIAIRLVYKKNGEICIRSGAGIVADSVPEMEFNECCNKARAVVNAIETAVNSKEL